MIDESCDTESYLGVLRMIIRTWGLGGGGGFLMRTNLRRKRVRGGEQRYPERVDRLIIEKTRGKG